MTDKNIENYSFLDPIINSNPFEFYKLLHKEKPVYQIPEIGMFMMTKYDDIRQALKDYETFSSDVKLAQRGPFADLHQSILVDGGGWEHVQTLQRTDPLDFHKEWLVDLSPPKVALYIPLTFHSFLLSQANTPVPDLPSFSTAPAPVRPLPPPSSFFACPFCHECLDAKPLESFT